jgi:hypothetical protein
MDNFLPTDDDENFKNFKEVGKRIVVDFMGLQVSFPQYLRLVKLQERVIKSKQVQK